jgi:hypothetical protein
MPRSTWARRRSELPRRQPPPGLSSPVLRTPKSTSAARRLVWVGVTAFLTAWFLRLFPFLSCRALFSSPTRFSKSAIPSEFALGVDTKFQQKYRIWVDRTPDRRLRDLRALHASRLHARLETQRKQIQVPMPRQRIRQRRDQLRRTGAAPHGSRPRRTRARRPDLVDTSKLYSWPKGQPSKFNDPGELS